MDAGKLLPTPWRVSAPTTSGEINPVILQTKFPTPIKIPEYFGANSIRFVDGPDAVKFDKVIAMVTMTIAEGAVDAYTIATTKMAPIPAPG